MEGASASFAEQLDRHFSCEILGKSLLSLGLSFHLSDRCVGCVRWLPMSGLQQNEKNRDRDKVVSCVVVVVVVVVYNASSHSSKLF